MALALTRRAPADSRTALSVTTSVDSTRLDLVHRLLAAAFAFALFVGLGAQIVAGMGLSGVAFGAMPAAVVGAAVIAACAALAGRGRAELVGYGVMAAALVVFVLVFRAQVMSGAAEALNALEAGLGQRSAVYNLPFVTGGAGDIAFFSCAFAAVLAAMCAQMALRGNIALACALALAAVVLSLLGFGGYTPLTIVFVLGILGCFILNLQVMNDVRSPRGVLVSLLGVALIAAACGGVLGAISRVTPLDAAGPRQALASAIDRIRYGGDSWAMPNGDLSDVGPLAASDRLALTVDGPEGATAGYLRGFVGERYADNQWSLLASDAVLEDQDLFYWLTQDGFSATSQIATAAAASGFEESAAQSATIAYAGARNTYAYLPYTYAGGSDATDVTDQSFALRDVRSGEATFDASASSLQKAYRIQTAVVDAQDADDAAIADYLADEASYREFVYDNYLGIPVQTAGALAAVAGSSDPLPADEAKERVLQILDDACVYDEKAGGPTDGSDFVTYFLTQGKRGYSVHYASAATLLMRYYGVPARYVEGYLASDEGGAVEVTEKDAHAWCEYYLDGVGWVVFEATPGFRDGAFYEPSENARVSEFGELYNMGANRQSTWQPQTNDSEDESKAEDEQRRGLHFNPLWFLLGLVLGALAALAVRARILRRRFAEMVDRFISVDPRVAIPEMFSYALHVARHGLGTTFENVPYLQQSHVAAATGMSSEESFEAAALLNERALFDEASLAEDDRSAMLEFLGEVWDNVRARCGTPKRLWLTWIKGIL